MKTVTSAFITLFALMLPAISFAQALDLNPFFNKINIKGQWSGGGSSTIYKGRNAGTYNDLQVILNTTRNPDNSWSVTVTTYNIPPKTTTSLATYWIDETGLVVQTGQYTAYANELLLNDAQLSFYTLRTDPVTKKEVMTSRNMYLKDGKLNVAVEIYDSNNELVQDFHYQLQPEH